MCYKNPGCFQIIPSYLNILIQSFHSQTMQHYFKIRPRQDLTSKISKIRKLDIDQPQFLNGDLYIIQQKLSEKRFLYGLQEVSPAKRKILEENKSINQDQKKKFLLGINNHIQENSKPSNSKSTQFSFSLDIKLSKVFQECQKSFYQYEEIQGKQFRSEKNPIKYTSQNDKFNRSNFSYPTTDQTLTSNGYDRSDRISYQDSPQRSPQSQGRRFKLQNTSINPGQRRMGRFFTTNQSSQSVKELVNNQNCGHLFDMIKIGQQNITCKNSNQEEEKMKNSLLTTKQTRTGIIKRLQLHQ